jgi:hypothetical protein
LGHKTGWIDAEVTRNAYGETGGHSRCDEFAAFGYVRSEALFQKVVSHGGRNDE